ncbi:unnamed protein product [Brachionus calyciflorus]|uniref:Helitron helicase-like domain-containing protein n=1 Tax=Brachionus calyciflorus TaxID=104777 RepID=A0A814B6I3_9BILA|nr:unnamed protein product [Brachionus calyciflorus]
MLEYTLNTQSAITSQTLTSNNLIASPAPIQTRNENFDVDGDFYNTFVEDEENQILLDYRIKNAINFPQASQYSLNKFQTDALYSLAFPKLFPNGDGDPTRKAGIKHVSEALGFKHLMKSVAKSYKNDEFYYAWAKHQRFKFWAYDRLRRHRSLEQCKIFLKHNVHEANLTIKDLKNIINTPQSDFLIKKMSAYSSKKTGSDAYCYPDHHWEELHRLMPGPKSQSQSQKYKNFLDNPHLVDWFFSYRLNEFLKVVFDDILDCERRWHRFEWQSRSAIHVHGAVKLKNDPDLVKLTTQVYIGRLAEKKLENKMYDTEEIYNQLVDDIEKSKESEYIIITYTDTLISAMNPRTEFVENCVPNPHPCSIKTSNVNVDDLEKDYENLINCCAEISLVRNDPYMIMHNRVICHHWRGNVDMQIILDKSAAINYMVKYATKREKAGLSLCQLFKDVIGPSLIEDNPNTKIRSMMIKSIAGKRDIGQCEVSRLLLSESLYNSSFNYVTVSTEIDSRQLNLNVNEDDESKATKNSLIDYYANRKQLESIKNQLVKIGNLISFVRFFKLDSNYKITAWADHDKTVVITLPKIRYNPDDREKYKLYCYHQTIKYSDWDILNINEIRNKDTAIEKLNNFLKYAPNKIL